MTSTLLRDVRVWGRGDALRDVLVRDGRVVSLTLAGEIAAPEAEPIDLEGRWLSPGLWDHHVHVKQAALVRQRVDVSGAGSPSAVRAIMVRRLEDRPVPEGTLLVGFGFRDGLWTEQIDAETLEAVAAPIAVISGDMHSLWANRAGYHSLGVEPPASGVLLEQDAFAVSDQLGSVDDDVLDAWVGELATAAAQRGVVGVVDFDFDDAPGRWTRWYAAGVDSLRVRAAVYPDALERAITAGLHTSQELPGSGGLGAVGPFKVIVDGALNTRTAWCHQPYPGLAGPAAAGLSTYGIDELVGLLRRATSAGFSPAVHAIGDRAATLALDAFAMAGTRGTMEHAQLLTPEDITRLAALGVVASVQPEHAMDDRDVADHYWSGRTDRAFALADLVRAGVSLQLGSDAPVAPLDPWITMAAAVFRARDGRTPWHPEQCLTLPQARAASGPSPFVSVGDVADLVVVETDPDQCDEPGLRAMPVAATMLGGRWTHRTI